MREGKRGREKFFELASSKRREAGGHGSDRPHRKRNACGGTSRGKKEKVETYLLKGKGACAESERVLPRIQWRKKKGGTFAPHP